MCRVFVSYLVFMLFELNYWPLFQSGDEWLFIVHLCLTLKEGRLQIVQNMSPFLLNIFELLLHSFFVLE